MKILITGGLGYIGSNCFLYLYKEHDIVMVDNLSNACLDNLNIFKTLQPNVKFYHIDITNIDQLRKVFDKHHFDIVIHLASYKSVAESVENPLIYYHNNVSGTIQVLRVMREFNCSKIIFSSSACVYDGNTMEPHDENETIDIDGLSNPYGKTKMMIEKIIKDCCMLNGFKAIILRFFNPIGTIAPLKINATYNKSNLEDIIIDSIKNNKQFKLFGNDYLTRDGTCIRDFIHIHDIMTGHLKAIHLLNTKDDSYFEIINLACGRGITVMEFLKEFESVHQLKLNYVVSARRPGDVPVYIAKIEKAKQLLDWSPQKSLTDICKDIQF